MLGFIIGLLILALILGGGYVVTHHKAPETPSAKDLSAALQASAATSWEALKRDLPNIVSAEVAQLRAELADVRAKAQADLDAMEARAKDAEAKLAAEMPARVAALEAVRAQADTALASIKPPPPPAPAPAPIQSIVDTGVIASGGGGSGGVIGPSGAAGGAT